MNIDLPPSIAIVGRLIQAAITIFILLSAAPLVVHAEPLLVTESLHPAWIPILTPPSLLVPGLTHIARGETETGTRLLALTGTSLGLASYGVAGLIAVGAADLALIVLGPPLLVAGSLYMALGGIDAIGGYSTSSDESNTGLEERPVATHSLIQTPIRARASYSYAPNPRLGLSPYVGGAAEIRSQGFSYRLLTTAALAKFDDLWLGGGIGFRQLRFTDQPQCTDGLHWGIDALYELNRPANYQTFGLNYGAKVLLPLALFWPRTLSDISVRFSLGISQAFTKYANTGSHSSSKAARGDTEWGLTGGFETRWLARNWLALTYGYEHARDGIAGSTGAFGGIFSVGSEFRLATDSAHADWWLGIHAQLSSPTLVSAFLERRW